MQEIGLLYLRCQEYVCRVVYSILLSILLMSAGSIAISHFIPDVGNYCPLSFFFLFPSVTLARSLQLKIYIFFKEPAFPFVFLFSNPWLMLPSYFLFHLCLGRWGGVYRFSFSVFLKWSLFIDFRLPTSCCFESIYYYAFPPIAALAVSQVLTYYMFIFIKHNVFFLF